MTNLSRTLWASAAAVCALVGASNAYADVYTYTETGVGNTGGSHTADLTVNTATGAGSLIGSGLDINFTGNFTGFTGGAAPSSMYTISILPGSSISLGGTTYSLIAPPTSHPDMLEFQGKSINLWAEWSKTGTATGTILYDTIGGISSSSTSGGTSVPEPGMVGLMGLGVLGLAFRRRIANAVAVA